MKLLKEKMARNIGKKMRLIGNVENIMLYK